MFLRPTRRDWLGIAVAGMASAAADAPRPNILYIMTDQQCAEAFHHAGCRDVQTPAIDRIAAAGVRFREAYCSNPLCVPARTSMMTGLMPNQNGVTYNDLRKPPRAEHMLGRVMADAGYDTGYFGKWHVPVPPKDRDRHGFATMAHTAANGVDEAVPQASIEFLQRQRSQPFFLVSSFVNPHDICEWARGTAGKDGPMVQPPEPDRCPALPANFAIPEQEPEVIRRVQAMDASAYPTRGWEPGKWRQYRFAYYRLIERVDAHIARILDVLRETGQERNTVIVFASDHGDGAAAHHWNQKQVLYEEPARVPFLIAWPGHTPAGRSDTRHLVASGIDLIPTFCDFAGVQPPKGLPGRSLRPLAEGRRVPWRDAVVCQTEFCTFNRSYGVHGRLLRMGRWKYVAYSEGKLREQLIDIGKDRGEMHNLALAESYRKHLHQCRQALERWCEAHGDGFAVPSG